jgi:GT2 family glycosyltransferase
MMDDDALPAADCLENLLKYKEASACLHPIHLDEQGRLQDEERWLNPASCNVVSSFNLSYTHGKKIWYRNTGSFEGMLVSAALVQQIGYPDTRFFMVHDDLSYAYLASKHTNVAVVSDAIIQKLPVSPTEASHLRYLYYEHRNLWLIEQYVAADLKGFDGYRKRRIKLKFIYSLYAIWNRSEFKNKWRAYKMLYRAYQDYRLKKEGNTF